MKVTAQQESIHDIVSLNDWIRLYVRRLEHGQSPFRGYCTTAGIGISDKHAEWTCRAQPRVNDLWLAEAVRGDRGGCSCVAFCRQVGTGLQSFSHGQPNLSPDTRFGRNPCPAPYLVQSHGVMESRQSASRVMVPLRECNLCLDYQRGRLRSDDTQ